MNNFYKKFLSILPDWVLWTAAYLILHYFMSYLLSLWNLQTGILIDVIISIAALFVAIALQILWDEFLHKKVEEKEAEEHNTEGHIAKEIEEVKEKLKEIEDESKGV